MTPVGHATQALGRPHHDVGALTGEHLLAAGAQVATARLTSGHLPHHPDLAGVPLAGLAHEQAGVESALVTATAIGSGHGHILATASDHSAGVAAADMVAARRRRRNR